MRAMIYEFIMQRKLKKNTHCTDLQWIRNMNASLGKKNAQGVGTGVPTPAFIREEGTRSGRRLILELSTLVQPQQQTAY
jgi:hypothetical protein